jgi:hypothetical protein
MIKFRINHCRRHGKIITYTTGGQVTGHPLPVSITLLLECEHRLVCVTESEVKGLCWEITDNVGSVASPQGDNTFLGGCAAEAVNDAIVFPVKTTSLQHLILFAAKSVYVDSM